MRHVMPLIYALALVACSEDKNEGSDPQDAAPVSADAAPEPMDAAPQPMDAAPQPMDAAPQPMDAAPEPMDAAPESADAAPPAECDDLSGMYMWEGDCTNPAGEVVNELYVFGCLTQVECVLSDDSSSLPVVGDEAALSFPVDDLACDLRFEDGSSSVTCSAPDTQCTAPQQRFTVPNAVSYCCDVARQDCGPGLRCQAFRADGMGGNVALYSACMPAPAEPLAENASCTREMGVVGADQCAPGLFCANFDQPRLDQRTCQPFCASDAGCEMGEFCANFLAAPVGGLCRLSCTVSGDDCPAGLTCRWSSVVASNTGVGPGPIHPACEVPGAGALGDVCATNTDCGPNTGCFFHNSIDFSDPRCSTMCDLAHPCGLGERCGLAGPGDNPQGIGGCVPEIP